MQQGINILLARRRETARTGARLRERALKLREIMRKMHERAQGYCFISLYRYRHEGLAIHLISDLNLEILIRPSLTDVGHHTN